MANFAVFLTALAVCLLCPDLSLSLVFPCGCSHYYSGTQVCCHNTGRIIDMGSALEDLVWDYDHQAACCDDKVVDLGPPNAPRYCENGEVKSCTNGYIRDYESCGCVEMNAGVIKEVCNHGDSTLISTGDDDFSHHWAVCDDANGGHAAVELGLEADRPVIWRCGYNCQEPVMVACPVCPVSIPSR